MLIIYLVDLLFVENKKSTGEGINDLKQHFEMKQDEILEDYLGIDTNLIVQYPW